MSLKNLLKENKSLSQWARNQTFHKSSQDALDAKTIESIISKLKPPPPSEPIEFISSTTYEKRQRGECDYCEKPTFKGSNWCEYHYNGIVAGLKEYFGL